MAESDEQLLSRIRDHLNASRNERHDNAIFAELKAIDPDAHQALWYMAREVMRQREEKGWSIEHDNEHDEGQMAFAASCYAHLAAGMAKCTGRAKPGRISTTAPSTSVPGSWPWDDHWWKPKNVNLNLIRAGALIAAE